MLMTAVLMTAMLMTAMLMTAMLMTAMLMTAWQPNAVSRGQGAMLYKSMAGTGHG